jgi:hypothetical protein
MCWCVGVFWCVLVLVFFGVFKAFDAFYVVDVDASWCRGGVVVVSWWS